MNLSQDDFDAMTKNHTELLFEIKIISNETIQVNQEFENSMNLKIFFKIFLHIHRFSEIEL